MSLLFITRFSEQPTAEDEPSLSIHIDDPLEYYYPGQTISGHVCRRDTMNEPGEATITMTLKGAIKSRVTQERVNFGNRTKDTSHTTAELSSFTTEEVVYRGPIVIPEKKQEWTKFPFCCTVPLAPFSQPGGSLKASGDEDDRNLPPSLSESLHDFRLEGTATVEYYMLAELRGRKRQLGLARRQLQLRNPPTEPLTDSFPEKPGPYPATTIASARLQEPGQIASQTQAQAEKQVQAKDENQIEADDQAMGGEPKKAEPAKPKKLSFSQKTKKLFGGGSSKSSKLSLPHRSSNLPRYSFVLALEVAHVVQLDNTQLLPPFLVAATPDWTQTSESLAHVEQPLVVQAFKLELVTLGQIKAEMAENRQIEAIFRQTLVDYPGETPLPSSTTGPLLIPTQTGAAPLDLGRIFPFQLASTGVGFKRIKPSVYTKPFRLTHMFEWELTVSLAGKEATFKDKRSVIVLDAVREKGAED